MDRAPLATMRIRMSYNREELRQLTLTDSHPRDGFDPFLDGFNIP